MCTTAVTVSSLKDEVRAAIEERSGAFVRLAHDIHAHSELALAEEYAAERITDVLVDEGFTVLWGVVGVPTAFVASLGNGSLHIAFCAERDALDDDIGHGCRHNLIAGVAVAAAVGLKGIVDEVGLTVSVIGTPGEELVGPKEPPAGLGRGPADAGMDHERGMNVAEGAGVEQCDLAHDPMDAGRRCRACLDRPGRGN